MRIEIIFSGCVIQPLLIKLHTCIIIIIIFVQLIDIIVSCISSHTQMQINYFVIIVSYSSAPYCYHSQKIHPNPRLNNTLKT